jgi:hypothetical protein
MTHLLENRVDNIIDGHNFKEWKAEDIERPVDSVLIL